MSTPNRAEINRANAQHSTGPKTEAGQKQSSLNALRHGLTGQIVVMPTEDLHAYQLHLKSFTDEYTPKGATESHLVQALADASWRLNRVAALETNLLTLGMTHGAPLTNAPQQVQDAMSIVAALETQSKALANLSMHSQRLSRQFERTVMQLRELQKTAEPRKTSSWTTSSTSWKCTSPKEKPTTHQPMASFFQKPKSTRASAPGTARA